MVTACWMSPTYASRCPFQRQLSFQSQREVKPRALAWDERAHSAEGHPFDLSRRSACKSAAVTNGGWSAVARWEISNKKAPSG